MLLTKNDSIKFNNFFELNSHPTKRVWDTSENRWGFRLSKKIRKLKLNTWK